MAAVFRTPPGAAHLAVFVSLLASAFLSMLRAVQGATATLHVPGWVKPGLGGLALGIFATPGADQARVARAPEDLTFDVLKDVGMGDVLVRERPYATLETRTPAREVLEKAAATGWQDVFPVLDGTGKLVGMC